jgi:hypothetical protein
VVIELNDWRCTLAPLFDPVVEAAADRLCREAGLNEKQRAATVEAARLKAAMSLWRRHGTTPVAAATGLEDRSEDQSFDVQGGESHADTDAHDGVALDQELVWWTDVARAFGGSPIVAAALSQAGHREVPTAPEPRVWARARSTAADPVKARAT